MDYFNYPLDTKALLRKKRSIKQELLGRERDWTELKVAVLGGSTSNEMVDQLELFLLHQGIRASFYQSEYGQYYEDAVFGTGELLQFHPDLIYIHTNWRNVREFPAVDMEYRETEEMLQREYSRFQTMWKALHERFACPIIQNNFDRPDYRLLGNRDIWDHRGRSFFLSRLNQLLYAYARENNNFYVNDIDFLASEFGLSDWNDPTYWNLYKYFCPLSAMPYLAKSVSDIIKSLLGKNKKVLALDLDNTLWGGVIGDDGVEGIQIGPETAGGQVFFEFQRYLKKLKDIGVLLAVASKNEEENAYAGLDHPAGVLRRDDFVSVKANWEPKDQNLADMARELSLGLDSFVFADDNPAERELVSAQLPMVSVPELESPENYVKQLDHSGYFETTELSKEDLSKTASYLARAQALSESAKFESYEAYLSSLSMQAVVMDFQPAVLQRVAQLTNKSNQFNLTTKRCTENEMQRMQEDPSWLCLCARLNDRFADHGIVTVIAGEMIQDVLHIRLWLMSCRVLRRGLENLMMNILVERAAQNGVRKIVGYYAPTAKNAMVKDFYPAFGFQKVRGEEDGECVYELKVRDYERRDAQIAVVPEN